MDLSQQPVCDTIKRLYQWYIPKELFVRLDPGSCTYLWEVHRLARDVVGAMPAFKQSLETQHILTKLHDERDATNHRSPRYAELSASIKSYELHDDPLRRAQLSKYVQVFRDLSTAAQSRLVIFTKDGPRIFQGHGKIKRVATELGIQYDLFAREVRNCIALYEEMGLPLGYDLRPYLVPCDYDISSSPI